MSELRASALGQKETASALRATFRLWHMAKYVNVAFECCGLFQGALVAQTGRASKETQLVIVES